VLKYLARYMTGGPISARRVVSHADGQVTFLARRGDQTGGTREQSPVTLPGVEFVRRWSQHILPQGLVKTRRYGGFSNHHCQRYLADCVERLPPIDTAPQVADDDAPIDAGPTDSTDDAATGPPCPACGEPMLCIAATGRPSWRDIMAGPDRPKWYDDG
jgi:hypothetical protein